jgi:hypothetical protein
VDEWVTAIGLRQERSTAHTHCGAPKPP